MEYVIYRDLVAGPFVEQDCAEKRLNFPVRRRRAIDRVTKMRLSKNLNCSVGFFWFQTLKHFRR
jgi:hypothetical protein